MRSHCNQYDGNSLGQCDRCSEKDARTELARLSAENALLRAACNAVLQDAISCPQSIELKQYVITIWAMVKVERALNPFAHPSSKEGG